MNSAFMKRTMSIIRVNQLLVKRTTSLWFDVKTLTILLVPKVLIQEQKKLIQSFIMDVVSSDLQTNAYENRNLARGKGNSKAHEHLCQRNWQNEWGIDEKDNVLEVLHKYIKVWTQWKKHSFNHQPCKALISERMLIEMPVKIEIKHGEEKEIQKLVNIFVRKIWENKLDVDGEDNVLEVQHKDIKVLTRGKKNSFNH